MGKGVQVKWARYLVFVRTVGMCGMHGGFMLLPCMNAPRIPHVPTVLTNTRYRAHFTHPIPHISSPYIYVCIITF